MEPKTSSGLTMPCDRNTSEDADQPPSKTPARVARKRTKTGCLTCRKRRIKCDEAQPTCQNCVKSRRACQYTKFTFKDHISAQRPPSLDPSHAMPGMNFMFAHTNAFDSMPGLTSQPSTSQHTVNHLPPPFAPLRPRPGAGGSSSQNDWANFELHPDYNSQPYNHFLSGFGIPNSQSPFAADSSAQDYTGMTSFHSSLFSNQEHPHFTTTSHDTPSMPSAIDTNFYFSAPQSLLSASSSNATSAFSSSSATGEYHRNSHLISPLSALTAHSDPSPLFEAPQVRTSDVADGFGRRTSLASTSSATPQPGITMLSRAFNDGVYGTLADGSRALQNASARHNSADHLRSVSDALENAAVEIEDDDYFDVLTDEEEAESILASLNVTHQSDLQVMHSLYHHSDLLRQRGIHAFIYPGIMDHYRPERVASPLKNDNTARVFAHFVAATGPMLSAFERVPRINPALVELGAMPTAHLSLWTFTLPMRALHNQGLLHAMLAMSSLHIARLQGASTIPSYSHYSWSVSRVHKAVGKREGRHEVAILAATLLLAFYEVMTADLIKWIPHLCGARQLILEIDYIGMARRITEMKAQRSAFSENLPFIEQSTDSFIDAFPEHDQEFIASLTGSRSWPLGGREQIDQKATPPHTRNFSVLELSNFEVLQDLYWWYVKQDMVHSIISGDPPLMHYSHWIRCPPRAPIGQRSAVYGSFDHVMLMLGRICDFTARDVARKVRANKAAGSPWPEVAFYGMAPATAAYMPHAFLPDPPTAGPAAEKPADFTAEGTTTLRAQTDLALAEWEDMEAAYDTLERALAVPGFLPLAEDEIGHYPTPFGTVVHYASYNIAILQMFVHMGRLMLARSHPFMPPSLAIAIGAAAAQTAEQAAQIGRIAAGVTPLLSAGDNLSPQLAGTFTDCTLPLFFAGVQYRDDLQRRWTASRLWEIEERSGWASAGLCARGCETAWERAGAMEGAPSYTPMQRPSVSEVRSRGGSVSQGPENSGAPRPGSAGHSQRSSVSVPMPIRGGHL